MRRGKRDKIIQALKALRAWEKRQVVLQSIGKSSTQARLSGDLMVLKSDDGLIVYCDRLDFFLYFIFIFIPSLIYLLHPSSASLEFD